jgi:hypothetical protein
MKIALKYLIMLIVLLVSFTELPAQNQYSNYKTADKKFKELDGLKRTSLLNSAG